MNLDICREYFEKASGAAKNDMVRDHYLRKDIAGNYMEKAVQSNWVLWKQSWGFALEHDTVERFPYAYADDKENLISRQFLEKCGTEGHRNQYTIPLFRKKKK